eukprot:TRINITY_DN2372_c0_g2_i3.p4 TRINITY_DN2372_c0_g2~~TRINITY_DN2372_c0_g2_i3.p4  ORF type:complete len:100 (-),score=1.48 TRINITY_DN2372_c0_g2_i3:95-394(-)
MTNCVLATKPFAFSIESARSRPTKPFAFFGALAAEPAWAAPVQRRADAPCPGVTPLSSLRGVSFLLLLSMAKVAVAFLMDALSKRARGPPRTPPCSLPE